MKWCLIAAATLSVLAVEPASAHHSTAMFDRDKEITVVGVVKQLQWTNPHSWLQVMAPDATGKTVEWSFEAGSPNILGRQGWNRNAVKPGDKVTVLTHPLRDGKPGGIIMQVTAPSGKIYYYHG